VALLEVRDVTRRFGAVTVVDRFSFDLERGDALGIVGPNGAGKTTLLNLVAGDLSVNSGSITFEGHDMTKVPAHRRCRMGIGRTSQVPRPFERMTVFENVLVGATFGNARGTERDELAVDSLRRTGMLDLANRPSASLTLLQRKRLELARALALPTFTAAGHVLIKRMAWVIDDGRFTKVFYPVFPPDRNAAEVVSWIRAR